MPVSGSPDVEVVKAVAAAIVTSSGLHESIATEVPNRDQKFVVHPHLADVNAKDKRLSGYLHSIYTGRPALQTAYAGLSAFEQLTSTKALRGATKAIAEALGD